MKTLLALLMAFCVLTPTLASDVAPSLDQLRQEALAKLQDGDYVGARESAEAALRIYRFSQSRRDQERAAALVAIANLDAVLGDRDSAEKRYAEALELLLRYFTQEHPEVKAVTQKLDEVSNRAAH